jgi:DNA repair protein RecO (recombination protein O)
MPVREAEGIVLRQYPLAEADRIVVLLTREYGKIRTIAKGIKRIKSRLAGCLEPLNHVQIELYAREGKELSYVRQSELLHSFLGRNPTLDRMYGFAYFTEIVQEFVQEDQPSDLMFRLLLAALRVGETGGANAALVRYFEFWSLKLNGLLPNYTCCSDCGRSVTGTGFYAGTDAGQVRCEACAHGTGGYVPAATASILQDMATLSPGQFASRPLPEQPAQDLERLAQTLLEIHLERRLKSYPVLRNLLRGATP